MKELVSHAFVIKKKQVSFLKPLADVTRKKTFLFMRSYVFRCEHDNRKLEKETTGH
jgi:hypothetical protein